MNFKKKLKTRLCMALVYITLGLILVVSTFIIKSDNEYLSPLGLAFVVVGIVRIRNYLIITKNDETMRKQEIAETDERNISILQKAKSATFSIYLILSCLAVIILLFLGHYEAMRWLSYSVYLLIAIYWVCYFIYSKKS